MSHYPRRRITITGCVLLVLGYALLRLPLDQKSYARESAKNFRGAMKAAKRKPPKGGMVRLKEITPVPVKEGSSGAMKQVRVDWILHRVYIKVGHVIVIILRSQSTIWTTAVSFLPYYNSVALSRLFFLCPCPDSA